jgi:hypothetical protein
MIENSNSTKIGEFVDVKRYIGVANINILAVNPDNEVLRKYGWTVPEGADEPTYTKLMDNGKTSGRVRFLCRINNLSDSPVVALDFWCHPDFVIGKESGKARIIDSYGRTAWATKEEIRSKSIPQYTNGPADINSDYKPLHRGQDKLVAFLFKYCNITPLQKFDRATQSWVPTKNPGRLTIDNWNAICNGDVSEIRSYVESKNVKDNSILVTLGVRTNDDNRTYQTFLDECDGVKKTPYFSVNSKLNAGGEYDMVRKRIDEFKTNHPNDTTSFSAAPVHEWKVVSTEVKDNSNTMFDDDGNFVEDDLPL